MEQHPAEVLPDKEIEGAWRVEKLDSDADGGVDITIFIGPEAQHRAEDYAKYKYGKYMIELSLGSGPKIAPPQEGS